MNAPVVFVGPTLRAEEVAPLLPGADLRAPASCGDVYWAARDNPRAIVIVDGYFEHRLAVWHKEILWALSRGIPVYGGASLGALRAAELADFGMLGVGQIFEWFRDGVLEDDDEVAVAHESSERGFRPTSDAMVNIRATFKRAEADGLVSSAQCAALVKLAKVVFYPARNLRSLLKNLPAGALASDQLEILRLWVADSTHYVDQKRNDAAALLARVRTDLELGIEASAWPFDFEYTEAWHELTRRPSR